MKGTFPRVTHPSAAKTEVFARLACVKPAASVRSEPGSNSQVETELASGPSDVLDLHVITIWRPISPRPKSEKVGHVVPASSSIPRPKPQNFLSRRHADFKTPGNIPNTRTVRTSLPEPAMSKSRRPLPPCGKVLLSLPFPPRRVGRCVGRPVGEGGF